MIGYYINNSNTYLEKTQNCSDRFKEQIQC